MSDPGYSWYGWLAILVVSLTATVGAARVGTTQVDPPPDTTPSAELVPPGTHCLNLLDSFVAEGGDPATFQWYGNVAWGETGGTCVNDHPNRGLAGGTWGVMQISFASWRRLCGLSSGSQLYDLGTTWRCTWAIEQAAGRRQWRPHNETTGCFPRGFGTQC